MKGIRVKRGELENLFLLLLNEVLLSTLWLLFCIEGYWRWGEMKQVEQDEEQKACIPSHVDRETSAEWEPVYSERHFRQEELPSCIQSIPEELSAALRSTGAESASVMLKSVGDVCMTFLTRGAFLTGELVRWFFTSSRESRQCLIPAATFPCFWKVKFALVIKNLLWDFGEGVWRSFMRGLKSGWEAN